MKAQHCCRHAAQWIAPGVGLALIPKCPGCVAAYVATLTGVGITMPMAARLRVGLLLLCATTLAYVAVRQGLRLMKRRFGDHAPHPNEVP